MRTPLLAAVVATSALCTPAAMAVDVQLYGVVNKALMTHDDGNTTESTIVDNNNESTRFGLAGEKALDNGLTASVLFEVEQNSNPSNAITQSGTGTNHVRANTPGSTSPGFNERMARVGLAGSWGALFVGQQDVASDDTFAHDLAAASSVMNPNFATFGGGLVFQTKTGSTYANTTLGGSDLTPGLFALGNDGTLAAADSIRYNSPEFAGFNGSLSISQGGDTDVALRYNHDYGAFMVDSAIGHTFVNSATTTTGAVHEGTTLASVSARHTSGLGATLAYGLQNYAHKGAGVENPEVYYAKVGYAWGPYGVAVDYGHGKNPVVATATNHSMDSYGVGGEYDMGKGVTLGAMFRNYAADVTGVSNLEDINLGVLNMKVKF